MYKSKRNKKVIKIEALLVIIMAWITMLTLIGIAYTESAIVDSFSFTIVCFFIALGVNIAITSEDSSYTYKRR